MNRSPFLLIDADVLAYQAAAGAEKIINFEGDTCTPVASLTDAMAAFEAKLSAVLGRLKTADYILAFSDATENNFRRALYPPYKMNRAGKPRPVALAPLKEAIMEHPAYGPLVYLRPALEADDCLGILATHKAFRRGRQKIIVSIDKDLKSIPGFFHDLGHPEAGVQPVTLEAADRWHMAQTLMGDAADGYPGCPKMGPRAVDKLFAEHSSTYEQLWPLVVQAFDRQGLGEEAALTQARVSRILRAEDYNFKDRKVNLWNPPNTTPVVPSSPLTSS